MPTDTASKWVALGVRRGSWGCGLGVPIKRGVRRRPLWDETGVDLPDLEPRSEEMEAPARCSVRCCWRDCTGEAEGVGEGVS